MATLMLLPPVPMPALHSSAACAAHSTEGSAKLQTTEAKVTQTLTES